MIKVVKYVNVNSSCEKLPVIHVYVYTDDRLNTMKLY